jgi:hypothetical protein
MPKEVSLNDPLSGAEIKAIILAEIGEAMDKNCTLVNDVAYAGFNVVFDVRIGFLRAPTKETLVWGGTKAGEAPTDPVEAVKGDYKTDSPNTARTEHDLATPVLVQTPDGPKRRKVKVAKKAGGK